MKKSRSLILALCLSVCLMSFTSCGSKSEKVFSLVDSGSYSEALEYYEEKIDGSSNERDIRKEIKNGFDAHYEAVLERYNNEESDDDDMEDLFELMESVKLSTDDDEYREFLDKYSSLKTSKQYYRDALKNIEDKDYSEAMYNLRYVVEDDSNYETAQTKLEEVEGLIADEKLAEVKAAIDSKQYGEAIEKAYNLESELKDVKKFEDMYKQAVDGLLKEADDKIDHYFKENDYDGARKYMGNIYNKYYYVEALSEKYNDLKNDYSEYIVKESKTYADKGDYQRAASLIEAAKKKVGDTDELTKAYDEYKVYIPIYIHQLSYLSSEGSVSTSDYFNGNRDNTDKEYDSYFCVDGSGQKEFWAEYYINGNYTKFSGVCAVSKRNANDSDTKYFEIYGDDKLLYTSPTMTKGVLPEEFSVDVTGVKVLKILYPGSAGNNSIAAIFNGAFVKESGKKAETTKPSETTAVTTAAETTDAETSETEAADEENADVTTAEKDEEKVEETTVLEEE